MRTNLRLPISALIIATTLVACGRKTADTAANDDFKRDLQTMGLSEASIHEIIPDATRPSASEPPSPQVPSVPTARAA